MFRLRLNMTRFHVIASVSVAINRVGIPRRLIAALAPLARNDKSPHFVILKPLAAEESRHARIMKMFRYAQHDKIPCHCEQSEAINRIEHALTIK